MRRTFQKFGKNLTDRATDSYLKIPTSFNATYDYKLNASHFGHLDQETEKLLKQSWTKKFTANIPSECLICGTTEQVEMHHLRRVADVRHKFRTGNASWKQIIGAVSRKQVPLCKYHHKALHSGNLNYGDIQRVARYNRQPIKSNEKK